MDVHGRAEKLQSPRKYRQEEITYLINTSWTSEAHYFGLPFARGEGVVSVFLVLQGWDSQRASPTRCRCNRSFSLENCWFYALPFSPGFAFSVILTSPEPTWRVVGMERRAPGVTSSLNPPSRACPQGCAASSQASSLSDTLKVSSHFQFLCGQSYLCYGSDPFTSTPRTAISTSSSLGQKAGGGLHSTTVWEK